MSKKSVDHLIKTNFNGIKDRIEVFRKPKKKGAQKVSRNNNSKSTWRNS